MTDRATPNLPSRSFDQTEQFYRTLGFERAYRDDGWMILECDGVELEFFPHPDLDPAESWFSCCLRLQDLDGFYGRCRSAAVPVQTRGFPRLHAPERQPWGGRMAALVDLDGTLLRLIED